MNYIQKLQEENKRLQRERAEAQEQVTEFLVHLSGPKFYQDTTIQVGDVQTRLMEIRRTLL